MGACFFCGGGAQALQVVAVAFMRLHDSGALRDEGGKAVLFVRLRGVVSPNILSPKFVHIDRSVKD